MKHISLATRYRPQRFDEIAGQDLIKAVLSRASAEDRVASGYLLSGTRGVGKTTIARIFAKALNCEHAPCAEPCNTCPSCRRITAGTHPDVVEMDGASNNTVDDARALRETVGFAPMEGRYKIFIIDEAHMLTRNAFNALLKTLEEPPPHVVFIFATTELFRFPATILSRCQVFSFRHLSEDTITAHLGKVLTMEGMPYEDSALRLIARRAAGSARDSMSLLDQILAYGPETLTAGTVRTVLGLAGMEALGSLFDALAAGSCADTALFTKELVSKEIDIGFFLRELTDTVRSLFLLRQCGRQAVARLGVPESELDFLAGIAPKFTPSYLHAAWQMILESQRSVSSSQEPASALELLLVNLALLPRLLPSGLAESQDPPGSSSPRPDGRVGQEAAPTHGPAAAQPRASQTGQAASAQAGHYAARRAAESAPQSGTPQPAPSRAESPAKAGAPARAGNAAPAASGGLAGAADAVPPAAAPIQKRAVAEAAERPVSAAPVRNPSGRPTQPAASSAPRVQSSDDDAPPWDDIPVDCYDSVPESAPPPDMEPDAGMAPPPAPRPSAQPAPAPVSPAGTPDTGRRLDMDAFRRWLTGLPEGEGIASYLVSDLRCISQSGDEIRLEGGSSSLVGALNRDIARLESLVSTHLGRKVHVTAEVSKAAEEAAGAGRAQVAANERPELRHCFEILKAHVERVHRII